MIGLFYLVLAVAAAIISGAVTHPAPFQLESLGFFIMAAVLFIRGDKA